MKPKTPRYIFPLDSSLTSTLMTKFIVFLPKRKIKNPGIIKYTKANN